MKGIKIKITVEELLMTIFIITWVSAIIGILLSLFVLSITRAGTTYDRINVIYTTLKIIMVVPGIWLIGWATKMYRAKKEEEDLNRNAQISSGDEISGAHGRSYTK